ncbi:hypothetical protein SUGI_0192390 [Cryptomeria japonica]|uniref:cytochrome b561 and DOMON domain-containing protein At2g04850 n=1 Tax=Cryptomeria japonica TaxID=3369 RepID=UPI002408B0A8|nr:cytochrome b561 and DOMON domain-containing protein At2g04850 [Cryptomeria japonica]GLJ12511.1 hypothetical protein SUGI_0192390 [Cryptomeria japonica]
MDSNSDQIILAFNLLFFWFLVSVSTTDGTGCKTQFSLNGMGEKTYQKCVDFQAQGASIAWTFFPHNKTLDIVFSGQMISPSGWIGWGINPVAPNTMVGTRALIAFRGPSGSSIVLPYFLDNAVKTQQAALVPNQTNTDFVVLKSSVFLSSSSSSARIFATLKLGSNPTSLNHVWNRGMSVQGYSPGIHGTSVEDLKCTKTIEMVSGSVRATPDNPISTGQRLRIIHGILNSISWGFLLFLGVITARYLGKFETLNPAWFYIHVGLQMTGYGIGVAGWAIGLKLGKMSQGVSHNFHRNLGIVIFTLGTLQIFALLFRPKKAHKLRKYWKSYHHFVGYACLIISIVNVFEGINLMGLSTVKLLYSLAISSLIGLCVVLEVNSWIMFFKSKREEEDAKISM